jgi:cytosine/adenosine deaminase-related metal-dependent hydrolase
MFSSTTLGRDVATIAMRASPHPRAFGRLLPTAVGSLVMAILSACGTEQTDLLAVVDVNVLPMDRNVVLEHHTVVIADGKIVSVGPAGTIEVPGGARRINGRGLYLMPGLADMHVHFVRPPTGDAAALTFEDHERINVRLAALHIANGVTTVRNMWGHPTVDALAARIAVEEVLGPTILSTGPLTGGDPPVHPGSRVVRGPEDAVEAVQEDEAHGRVGVKVYDRLDLQTYQALAAAARAEGLMLTGHVPRAVGLQNVISERQATIEHVDSFLRDLQREPPTERQSLAEAYRNADVTRLDVFLADLASAGTFVTPTLVVAQMDWPPERIAPGAARAPTELAERYKNYFSGVLGEVDVDAGFAVGFAVVRKLHDAGVPLLAGTDTYKPNVVPGFALVEELEYFSEAGLAPYEALRTATANPAMLLGQEDEFGTVADGRRADLLLLSGNPLEGLDALRRLEGVILRGRFYTIADLSRRIEADSE